MNNIIILGDVFDRILTQVIVNTCEQCGGVRVFDGKRLYSSFDSPKYQVFCTDELRSIEQRNTVVGWRRSRSKPRFIKWMDDTVCILDSSDKLSLTSAEGCKNVIGCSMSEHDTLGICGYSDELSPMISLKRTIKLGDRLIEPCDFIVHTTKILPVFPVLAASAILLVDK